MHFNGPDQRHGFEQRLVGDLTSSFPGINNEERIYEDLKGTSYQGRVGIEKSGHGGSAVIEFDNGVTDAACRYIAERQDDRPLFMVVGWYAPHCPYVADKELFDHYYETLPVLDVISAEEKARLHPAIQKWIDLRDVDDVTQKELHRVRAAYYALTEIMDRNAGLVMQSLESHLDMDNTIVIYGSDHGDNLGEHGLFWKTNFYEGASRVPLTIAWRNVIRENVRLEGLTCLADIAPTLIEAAGAPELPKMYGMSLLDRLKSGEAVPEGRAIISQLADIKGDAPSAMIRKGNFKLVIHAGYESPQLFNLKDDPDELNDLGIDPNHSEIIQALSAELREYWDPDQALADLEIDNKHQTLIKQWINNIGWTPLEEWETRPGDNYFHTDTDTDTDALTRA